jgi:tRNA threonylcarbamoyladenosine biosynthesis protein TsaE
MAGEQASRRFLSRSVEATERLGEALGRRLVPGCLVALEGELGAGKTALVRGLARGLGAADETRSPTFTLMQEHEGRVPLFHFDAWMSGREALFLEGGGAEYLTSNGVAAVEWAERIEAYLPRPRLAVRLCHHGRAEREVELALVEAEPGAARVARELEANLRRALAEPQGGEGLEELPVLGGSRIP